MWDADLRRSGAQWNHYAFRGDRWTSIHKVERQRYLLNAYRVLLTRARQGMVIFVPPGDADDATRLPPYYDETYTWCGAESMSSSDTADDWGQDADADRR